MNTKLVSCFLCQISRWSANRKIQGLAERRERRRAKRAILSPPPRAEAAPSTHSSSASSHLSEHHQPAASPHKKSLKHLRSSPAKSNRKDTKKRSKPNPTREGSSTSHTVEKENAPNDDRIKTRKKTKSKVAPGLALMQNFQAHNIARSRITVCNHSRRRGMSQSLILLLA